MSVKRKKHIAKARLAGKFATSPSKVIVSPATVNKIELQPEAATVSELIDISSELAELTELEPQQAVTKYDENLFERARTQWQFGDWESLVKLDWDTICHHPDRGKLALLVAAALLQMDRVIEAKKFITIANNEGVNKNFINRILIAGVHNTLGRVAVISDQHQQALWHFDAAISIGAPGSDVRLLTQARLSEQISQLRADTDNNIIKKFHEAEAIFTAGILPLTEIQRAWQVGRWDYLSALDNAELARQHNRGDIALYAACGYQQLDDTKSLQRCVRLAQDWGCPRDRIKQYLAAGIRNTLALSNVLAGQYESAASNFAAALTVSSVKPKQQLIMNRVRRQLRTLKHIDVEQVFDDIAKYLE